MDFNSAIDLIIRELNEARDIIDDLKRTPGVPLIEIELAKSKCRNAAEIIALLKEARQEPPAAKKEVDTAEEMQIRQPVQVKEDAKEPVADAKEKKKKDEKTDEQSHLKQQKTKKAHAGETEPGDPVSPHEDARPEEQRTPARENKPFVAPIIADTFSHLANRFNEQIGTGKEDDYHYIKGKQVSKLSEAIGVNDKFLFIREIFDGNREEYNNAISRLEQAINLSEAKAILDDYRNDKKGKEAFSQLFDLVKRKFTPNE